MAFDEDSIVLELGQITTSAIWLDLNNKWMLVLEMAPLGTISCIVKAGLGFDILPLYQVLGHENAGLVLSYLIQ